MKVFISHITEEAPLALAMKGFIERKCPRASVFASSDVRNLTPGDQWLKILETELQESDVLLLLCSRASLARPWINFEAGSGWMRAKKLIPVCHSGQQRDQLPYPFRLFQAVQLEDPRCLSLILSALTSGRPSRTQVDHTDVDAVLSARPAVTADPMPQIVHSRRDRTRLITNDLRTLLSSDSVRTETVWSSAFLSTLAIGPDDQYSPDDQPYHALLLEERDALIELARRGCCLRILISPANENHVRPGAIESGIRRTERLLALLQSDDRALAHIDWAVSDFENRNLYIVGHLSCFEGYKRAGVQGYGLTLRQTSREVIDANIAIHEGLFDYLSTHTLIRWSSQAPHFASRREGLRWCTVASLTASLAFLRQTAQRQQAGDARGKTRAATD